MRSSSFLLLAGLVFSLMSPSPAFAQDYSPIRESARFDPLPIEGTTAPVVRGGDIFNCDNVGFFSFSQTLVSPFHFYGSEYRQVNMSMHGYLTFGTDVGSVTTFGMGTTLAHEKQEIPSPAAPTGIVAAFWEELCCPAGTLGYQTFVKDGSQWSVFEWNGCYRYDSVGNVGSVFTVQAQVWLEHGANIIRVHYGEMLGGPAEHGATIGIENPATYKADGRLETTGGVFGTYGVLSDTGTPICTTNCNGDHVPANTMIQYGRTALPDLRAGILDYTSLSVDTQARTIQALVENTIENVGWGEAGGVHWQLYLSDDDRLDVNDLPLAGCRYGPEIALGGGRKTPTSGWCTFDAPEAGSYHFCVEIDSDKDVKESRENNNTYCSPAFGYGADLTGSVSIPEEWGLGSRVPVEVRLKNAGTHPSGEFEYTITWRDCGGQSPDRHAHTSTTTLGGGENVVFVVDPYIDSALEVQALCVELVIDKSSAGGVGAVAESREDNNVFSTCVAPNRACMTLTRPNLRLDRISADLPQGCFFGEPVDVEFEVCNGGRAAASNFGAVVGIGTYSLIGLDDTRMFTIPRSCSAGVPSGCPDLGGGLPECIKGICHTPCTSDADCAGLGLECIEDPLLDALDGVRRNSCQLALAADECRRIRTSTIIPTINTGAADGQNPDGIPYTDGTYTVGGIVDWNSQITETSEIDNRRRADVWYTCWTRRPDFEAAGLRSLSPIGAGERFPVYRTMRNKGAVGGMVPYRYVLSSNETISKFDIPLTIVRIEDGQIVGESQTADVEIDPFVVVEGFDTVRVPAGVFPGSYYLGIVVDPDDEVFEVSNDNNAMIWCDTQADGTCRPHRIEVVDPSLRIVTQALPIATVGQSYDVQLLATGGVGGYQWRISSEPLRESLLGLEFDSNGRIHGTVEVEGDAVFQATVSSGELSASATFGIRALPARGPLAIATSALPTAYVNVDYEVGLGASGGTPPYTWTCAGLPAWARLEGNAILGRPTAAANATSVSCTVSDAAVLARDNPTTVYELRVMAASHLRIRSTSIGAFEVGVADSATINAEGGSGAYSWTFDHDAIPAGLQAVAKGSNAVVEGTPTVCGSFLVGVAVTDTVTDVTDSAELPLVVGCDSLRLVRLDLPAAVPDEIYPETTLAAEGAEGAAAFAIVLGELPRGLVLSKIGVLSGKVTPDATLGDHSVAVELRDEAGRTGPGALTIAVRSSRQETPRDDEKIKLGCSASGRRAASGFLPLSLLSALLVLRKSRSRKTGIALVAVLVTLVPTTAYANAWIVRDVPYERLAGDDVKPAASNCAFPANGVCSWTTFSSAAAPIPLPFTFGFFEQQAYDQVQVDVNGLLHFAARAVEDCYTSGSIPRAGAPNAFITPWWAHDEKLFLAGADIRYLVRGEAPDREFVVEWVFVHSISNAGPSEMQVSLYENGEFAMRWGSPGAISSSGNAALGIEDATGSAGSIAVLDCSKTASCSKAHWTESLQNKEFVFSSKPNLVLVTTSTTPEGRVGVEQEFRVVVRNTGVRAARAAIQFYISKDQELSEDDHPIGRTRSLDFGVGSTVEETITDTLPRTLGSGLYYVLARVDPDDRVDELFETDNVGAYGFVVRPPSFDLVVNGIEGPRSGPTGSRIPVVLQAANLGEADVTGVPYSIALSANSAISESDRIIHSGYLDFPWMSNFTITVPVELPVDMPAGRYFLGALVDPANVVVELDELNNVRASERTILVTAGGLRVATQLPPSLQVGAPYCFPLVAEGGDGVYTWSCVAGTLPPGLVLDQGGEGDPDGAWLCGAPAKVGIYDFTLAVASDGMTTPMAFSLSITVVPAPLDIASRTLPIARFGVPYEAGFSAHGGRPPYRWEILSGELPGGLTLGEDGLVYGMPLVDGEFSFEVQVEDANQDTVSATVELAISGPGRLSCSTRTLGSVELGAEIGGRLRAGGGSGSYVWESVSTQRYDDAGGLPLADERGPPPGIELRTSGALEGRASQIGYYLWTVRVIDGGNADTCTISFEVLAGPGLTVSTTVMPVALVDEEYSVQLRATGGDGKYRWKLIDPGSLPQGLGLVETGIVSGKLLAADLREKESRTWSFLVEVRDGQNRRGVGAMAVTLATRKDLATVLRRTETTESGCSTGGGGFGLVALGLVLLGLRRRR